jgi:hypothetical protein
VKLAMLAEAIALALLVWDQWRDWRARRWYRGGR